MEKLTNPHPSFLARLRGIKTRISYYLEIQRNLATALSELKIIAETRSNETYVRHLQQIGRSQPLDLSEISYVSSFIPKTLIVDITKNGPDRETVVCAVALGAGFRQAVQVCLDRQSEYCRAQGYDYARLDSVKGKLWRHPNWYKIPLIFKLMQMGYKRIFYIDADALITNAEIRLEPFFDAMTAQDKTVYMAEDFNGINAGLFFILNCPDAIRLLDLIWNNNPGEYHLYREQGAFRRLLEGYSQVRRLLLTPASAKAFNSYPKESDELFDVVQDNIWTEGDFICHFAGIGSPHLGKLIDHYAGLSSRKTK